MMVYDIIAKVENVVPDIKNANCTLLLSLDVVDLEHVGTLVFV